MSTLLDECRAAAPAWMEREGWTVADDTRRGGVVMRWNKPDGGSRPWAEIHVSGWNPHAVIGRVRHDHFAGCRLGIVCRVSGGQYFLRSTGTQKWAGNVRLAPALSYVAGEVRAEMVARGLVTDPEPCPCGTPGCYVGDYPDDDGEHVTCEVCGSVAPEDADGWTHSDTPEDGRLHFCAACSALPNDAEPQL